MLKFCCGTLFVLGLARANKSYLVSLNLTVGARAAKEKNKKKRGEKNGCGNSMSLSYNDIAYAYG